MPEPKGCTGHLWGEKGLGTLGSDLMSLEKPEGSKTLATLDMVTRQEASDRLS
jgi:hypothetical protein